MSTETPQQIKSPKPNEELTNPADFLLDEVDGNVLKGEDRKRIGEEVTRKLVESGDFGIGKHIAIREFKEYGENAGVLVIRGVTESEVPGLNYTEHKIIINVSDFSSWRGLSQEERREKFYSKVLLNVDQIITGGNGWDGDSGVMEPYAAMMLQKLDPQKDELRLSHFVGLAADNPLMGNISGPLTQENIKGQIVRASQHVMFIAESTMGSMGGLDPEKALDLDEDGIELQKLELMRNIGWEITEARLNQIKSEGFQKWKFGLAGEIIDEMHNLPDPSKLDEELQRKIDYLNFFIDQEEQVRSGRLVHNMWALAIGHSMNGNIVTKLMADVVAGQTVSSKYQELCKKWKQEEVQRCFKYAVELNEAQEKVFNERDILPKGNLLEDKLDIQAYKRGLGNERIKKMWDLKPGEYVEWVRKNIRTDPGLKNIYDLPEDKLDELYKNLCFQAWMPVIYGNNADTPPWAESMPKEYQVLLQRDPLLVATNELQKYSPETRRKTMQLGEDVKILVRIVNAYVGPDVPADINTIYLRNLIDNGAYAVNCSRILDKMDAPFKNIKLTKEQLARYTMMVGDKDVTLLPSFMVAMRKVFAETFGHAEYSFIREFKGAGHHPRIQDMDIIMADAYGKLIWHKMKMEERMRSQNKRIKDEIVRRFN